MQKGFAPLLIIIILALLSLGIVAGAYYWNNQANAPLSMNQPTITAPALSSTSPTVSPDPTANWKTYISKDGTFRLKYPPTLSYRESTVASFPEVHFSSTDLTTSTGRSVDDIRIVVAPNSSHLTLDNALGHGPVLSYDQNSNIAVKSSVHRTKVDGIDAIAADQTGAGPGGESDLIIIKNNLVYEINMGQPDPVGLKVLYQMLSTFKFLQ